MEKPLVGAEQHLFFLEAQILPFISLLPSPQPADNKFDGQVFFVIIFIN